MKTEEVKLRVIKFIEKTIDLYLPMSNVINRLTNATAKIWINQNSDKIDGILRLFEDECGEIDTEMIICKYDEALFENGELRVNIRDIIEQYWGTSVVTSMLPNKVVLFTRNDLHNIFI